MPRYVWSEQGFVDATTGQPMPIYAEAGTLAEVVGRYGAWADREITISGSPPMVRATTNALLDAGTPFRNIHYDPYHTD